jgi:hypothetical protein
MAATAGLTAILSVCVAMLINVLFLLVNQALHCLNAVLRTRVHCERHQHMHTRHRGIASHSYKLRDLQQERR